MCVGEESSSLADALLVSLEAPEDVDPSHRGVAPPLGESGEAVDAKSSLQGRTFQSTWKERVRL